eukprot:6894992-Pyramimonas_sp.AAC.1
MWPPSRTRALRFPYKCFSHPRARTAPCCARPSTRTHVQRLPAPSVLRPPPSRPLSVRFRGARFGP